MCNSLRPRATWIGSRSLCFSTSWSFCCSAIRRSSVAIIFRDEKLVRRQQYCEKDPVFEEFCTPGNKFSTTWCRTIVDKDTQQKTRKQVVAEKKWYDSPFFSTKFYVGTSPPPTYPHYRAPFAPRSLFTVPSCPTLASCSRSITPPIEIRSYRSATRKS